MSTICFVSGSKYFSNCLFIFPIYEYAQESHQQTNKLYRGGSEYSGGGWDHWRPLLWGPVASVGSVPASTSASGLHCPFSGPRCPLSARHGMGGVWCGAGHCTARRCTGIQVTSNGPEMQEIMFYVLRRSWALNSFQEILRLLPFTVKITNIQKYQCQVKSRHEVYIMKIIDHHESQYGTFCRINRFSYHNIVF